MPKRLFDLVALLSLLLLVSAAMAWARSHFPERVRALCPVATGVVLLRAATARPGARGNRPNDFAPIPARWGRLGFEVYRPRTPTAVPEH